MSKGIVFVIVFSVINVVLFFTFGYLMTTVAPDSPTTPTQSSMRKVNAHKNSIFDRRGGIVDRAKYIGLSTQKIPIFVPTVDNVNFKKDINEQDTSIVHIKPLKADYKEGVTVEPHVRSKNSVDMDSGSLILKILNSTGQSKIEIKLSSNETNNSENNKLKRLNFKLILISNENNTYETNIGKNAVICILPNDTMEIHKYDKMIDTVFYGSNWTVNKQIKRSEVSITTTPTISDVSGRNLESLNSTSYKISDTEQVADIIDRNSTMVVEANIINSIKVNSMELESSEIQNNENFTHNSSEMKDLLESKNTALTHNDSVGHVSLPTTSESHMEIDYGKTIVENSKYRNDTIAIDRGIKSQLEYTSYKDNGTNLVSKQDTLITDFNNEFTGKNIHDSLDEKTPSTEQLIRL